MLFCSMEIVWDIIHCATFQCIDETQQHIAFPEFCEEPMHICNKNG